MDNDGIEPMAIESSPDTGDSGRAPHHVAAIDIGSNAIRYLAAAVQGAEALVVLESRRYAVRLGHDAFTIGHLTPASIDAAIEVAHQVRARMEIFRIGRCRAVATSAVRESSNADDLCIRFEEATGLKLELISGLDEARLVWNAVRRRVPLDEGRWLLADLGGGSVEIVLVEDCDVVSIESYRSGAVRLLESLGPGRNEDPELVARLEGLVADRLPMPAALTEGIRGVVITGGSAEALGDLARIRRMPSPAPPSRTDGSAGLPGVDRISLDELRGALAELERMSLPARMERFRMRPDRADVIIPAAVVFGRIARLANASELFIPRVGLKEGIVYELADAADREGTLSPVPRAST